MTSATTTRFRREGPFLAVQLLPAPATVAALALAARHDLGAAPLALIAVVGALATTGSALLPVVRPAWGARSMPAPSERDRHRGDTAPR